MCPISGGLCGGSINQSARNYVLKLDLDKPVSTNEHVTIMLR